MKTALKATLFCNYFKTPASLYAMSPTRVAAVNYLLYVWFGKVIQEICCLYTLHINQILRGLTKNR